MALGETLKNARVQRGLTPSDVAENTHLMVQVVEDLEREDFRRIAAPIYGRGFIKLYAELLELDAEPLIRDFMELYAGARAPAVRTKKVEMQAESASEAAPVTRTVSGHNGSLPQRQPVQPRPAVRPLSMPQADAHEEKPLPELPREMSPMSPADAAVQKPSAPQQVSAPLVEELPPAKAEPLARAPETADVFVVEPETEAVESDEPDLFRTRLQPARRTEGVEGESEEEVPASGESRVTRKRKFPIFKIGGRIEETREPSVLDDAAHARRRERVKSFVDGVTKLKEGIEGKLPPMLPHKQFVALGGVGLVVLVLMIVGIRVLFQMTDTNVNEKPGSAASFVAPPPDLFVD